MNMQNILSLQGLATETDGGTNGGEGYSSLSAGCSSVSATGC